MDESGACASQDRPGQADNAQVGIHSNSIECHSDKRSKAQETRSQTARELRLKEQPADGGPNKAAH